MIRPYDTLVAAQGCGDPYWVGLFEDDIAELGIRAAVWIIEENDGGSSASVMLEEWADRGYPRMISPRAGR